MKQHPKRYGESALFGSDTPESQRPGQVNQESREPSDRVPRGLLSSDRLDDFRPRPFDDPDESVIDS